MHVGPFHGISDGGLVIGRCQTGRLRCVGGCPDRMRCHVGHGRRVPRRPGGSNGRRGVDLPGRRMRLGRQGANRSDPQLAASEGPDTLDGLPGAHVAWSLGLKQRQGPLGAVGGPHGQHAPVVLAQRQGTWLTFDVLIISRNPR